MERLDFHRLSDGAKLRALTYAALFEMVGGGRIDVNLVVGLSVEVLQGPDVRDTIRQHQGWLVGRRAVDLPLASSQVGVRGLVRAALDTTVGEVTVFVEPTWGNGRQFSHLSLAVGGCSALGDRLHQKMPHGTLLDDPVTANARGLARLAQRPGPFRWVLPRCPRPVGGCAWGAPAGVDHGKEEGPVLCGRAS